jgi:O-antigen ligase
VVLVAASLALVAFGVVTGVSPRLVAGFAVFTTLMALARPAVLPWRRLIATLIFIILFVPIRRYTLPAGLPFQLELYRVFVIILLLGWSASLLADPRTRLRRTGFEGPVMVIIGAAFASILANPGRVTQVSTDVNKSLMFFMSFILVLYLTTGVIRRLDDVDYLTKKLVAGGAVVAAFAIVEARTGFNAFNHLRTVMPFLRDQGDVGGFGRGGKLRVFGSAQHPIALCAALVMLLPLALYLARRYRQRRWTLCALVLGAASAATVSRTGIVMLVVVGLVFLWLRPRETCRMWPAIFPALIAIHFVVPGTLGAIKNSFFPAGGLVAQQKVQPGGSGSGRLADLGPGLKEWRQSALIGEGFGTRVVDASLVPVAVDPTAALRPKANIVDDQWLGTLLETGAVGAFGWLWLFIRAVRRFGAEAKRDASERGWLLTSIAASVAAYAFGMTTYDAFSFIQVTFLLFIFIGLGAALMAERPTPLAYADAVRG